VTVAELSRSLAAWRGRQRARAPGAATTEPRAAARPLGRPGRSRPEPMPQLALTVGPVRVSHQLEMAQDPPQPRRVQPPGRRHQHRLSLNRDLVGQVLGAMSQHPSMSHRELPTNQRLGGRRQRTTEQRRAVRTLLAAVLAPRRNRARSQPAVEPTSWPWSAPAAPPPSTAASCWSQWPSSRSTSPRNPRTCSAKAASVSRSSPARPVPERLPSAPPTHPDARPPARSTG